MTTSPWAALLAPKTPAPTTTQADPETPPEGSPAAPGPIPIPSTCPTGTGLWSHQVKERAAVAWIAE